MGDLAKTKSKAVEKYPAVPHADLCTRPRREKIIAHIKGVEYEEGKGVRKSFLQDAARHSGILPKILYQWKEHGDNYPRGPLGPFARSLNKAIAERNDEIQQKIWDTAEKSNRWEAFARIGEQFDADTWKRPSDKQSTTVNVNIIDKLAQINASPQNLGD